MTIQIKPEQERTIDRAIKAGLIKTADQAVEIGVQSIRRQLKAQKATGPQAKNLAELFADSPFAGLNMNFQRNPDTGRTINLS